MALAILLVAWNISPSMGGNTAPPMIAITPAGEARSFTSAPDIARLDRAPFTLLRVQVRRTSILWRRALQPGQLPAYRAVVGNRATPLSGRMPL